MSHQKFYMKKIILGLSLAGLFMSCQKVQEGSNKSVMRLNNVSPEGLPYNADAQGVRTKQVAAPHTQAAPATVVVTDSTKMPDMKEVASPTDPTKSPQMDVK